MSGLQAFFQSEWFRTLIFLVSTPLMIVLIRLSGETFEDHTYFFLAWMFAFQTVCGSIHCAYFYYTGAMKLDESLDTSSRSWMVLAVMAFFITGNAAGAFATSAYISGPLQTILGMSIIIVIPIFDWILLGAPVNWIQLLGVVVCLLGIAITVIYETKHHTISDSSNNPLAMLMLVISIIPMPIVNMIAENWFGDRPAWHPHRGKHADFEWGTLRYVFLQIPWHIPYVLVYMAAGIPKATDLGSNLESGWRCMMLFEATSNPNENCDLVLWIAIATGITTYVQILSSFYISVNESAAYSIVLQALSKFSANFIFGSKVLLGRYRDEPGPTIWPSLFVGFLGIAIYRYGKYRGSPEGMHSRLSQDIRNLIASVESRWSSIMATSTSTPPHKSHESGREEGGVPHDALRASISSSSTAMAAVAAGADHPTWFTRAILGGECRYSEHEDSSAVSTTNPIVIGKSPGHIEMRDIAPP
jgi:drug/metabolite transporter (DMT)-like permease